MTCNLLMLLKIQLDQNIYLYSDLIEGEGGRKNTKSFTVFEEEELYKPTLNITNLRCNILEIDYLTVDKR